MIDTMDVGEGTAYLTYNGSTGKNCVVTVPDRTGTPTGLGARLRLHRTDTVWKQGVEVDWGGAADSSYTRADYGVHCG
ncbi:hypothetical protein AQJ23_32045 [Streptomyces antibioticus]|nr:hypothetical protein [Streptomyces antibioticus]KUN21549.1 hypothetical protein AQJ23_32045 [Streptomyces antibioticus]